MRMSEPQQNMLSHWTKLSMRDGALPSRADMRLQDIGRYASKIIIVDIKTDPLDFEYRLIGQDVADELDQDYTGIRISELPGKGPGSDFWDHMIKTCEEGRPNFWTEICKQAKVGEKEAATLYLPLASDHKTPDKVMLVIQFGRSKVRPIQIQQAPHYYA
ncbi:hypothetical protein [Kordiimonas sp.]|uniref:hypothetical protein n=1 Tax=Kordiimonas sp. TaxID=1970157 RepID=UPI003A91B03B